MRHIVKLAKLVWLMLILFHNTTWTTLPRIYTHEFYSSFEANQKMSTFGYVTIWICTLLYFAQRCHTKLSSKVRPLNDTFSIAIYKHLQKRKKFLKPWCKDPAPIESKYRQVIGLGVWVNLRVRNWQFRLSIGVGNRTNNYIWLSVIRTTVH